MMLVAAQRPRSAGSIRKLDVSLERLDRLFGVGAASLFPRFRHSLHSDITKAGMLVDIHCLGEHGANVGGKLLAGLARNILDVTRGHMHIGKCRRGKSFVLIAVRDRHI